MKMEGMSETVNLFDCLVKANAILFHYTTPDGRNEVVKFPLAGFCENYLMQFAKQRQEPYGSMEQTRVLEVKNITPQKMELYILYILKVKGRPKKMRFSFDYNNTNSLNILIASRFIRIYCLTLCLTLTLQLPLHSQSDND